MCVRVFILAYSLLIGGASLLSLSAQSLLQEPELRLPMQYRPMPSIRDDGPDTLAFSTTAPFFDDFAYPGPWPDIELWFVDDVTVPTVNRNSAVSPPSYGVATFDGVKQNNEVYVSSGLSAGTTDRLLSHYIDLSGLGTGNSLALSFFLQPQGLGEAPEATDSFKVFFRTNRTGAEEFEQVLAVGGSPVSTFRQYVIPLDQARYFHTGFQLRFESEGSQNGPLDVWHLDYVLLGAGRSPGDTTYQDIAISQVLKLPLSPYSAVPIQHYENLAEPMTNPQVEVHNFTGGNQVAKVEVSLSDPLGGSPLSGIFSRERNITLSPYETSLEAFPAFSEQPLGGIGVLDMEALLINDGDSRPRNNVLIERTRIDSILAYDDGEADQGFGLNVRQGFGIEVELTKPDTLTAVWIHFVPFIHFNGVTGLVTYLKDQAFRLAVWDDPHPDSLLVQQSAGMRVKYGPRVHAYQRYPLSKPTAVPTRFWVGIQQTDSKAIGVGFDQTYDRQTLTYYDSLGIWTRIPLKGALMIRPEFQNERPVPASNAPDRQQFAPALRLFPNPAQAGGQLTIDIQDEVMVGRYIGELRDLQGRLLQTYPLEPQGQAQMQVTLPNGLPQGLYLWRHHWQTYGGQKTTRIEKIWIH